MLQKHMVFSSWTPMPNGCVLHGPRNEMTIFVHNQHGFALYGGDVTMYMSGCMSEAKIGVQFARCSSVHIHARIRLFDVLLGKR